MGVQAARDPGSSKSLGPAVLLSAAARDWPVWELGTPPRTGVLKLNIAPVSGLVRISRSGVCLTGT